MKTAIEDIASPIMQPETIKKLADEVTEFIKKNPWAAVLGAVAIGYLLGVSKGSKR